MMDRKFKISSFCDNQLNGTCVGVAIEEDAVLVTNTSGPSPVVKFTHEEWVTFVKGVRNGEFDV